jgi:hypothetical protein
VCVKQHRQQLPTAVVHPVQRHAHLVLLLQLDQGRVWQRVDVRHFFGCLVEDGLARARGDATAQAPPRRAFGGSQDPGADAVRVLDLVEALDQGHEDLLEHVGRGVLVEPGPARDRVDEPLVAMHERFPGVLVAVTAGSDQCRVAGLTHYP